MSKYRHHSMCSIGRIWDWLPADRCKECARHLENARRACRARFASITSIDGEG